MSLNVGGPISGSVGPQTSTFSAPDQTVGFGSIIVSNSSGSTINVYVGQNGTQGTPDYTIAPSVVATYPIPGATFVTVQFATFPTTGTVSVQLIDAVLSTAASVLPGQAGGIGVFPAASQIINSNQIFFAEPPGYGTTIVTVSPPQAFYLYSYSLSAYNSVASTVAEISVFASNTNGQIAWMFASNLDIACSGGPIPLLYIPGVAVQGVSTGTAIKFTCSAVSGTPSFYGVLNLSYAVF
jgi:hypothetical protein